MAGGIRRWKELKLPLVKDEPLTAGPDGALQPPLHADAGRREGAEAAPPLEGAPDRRGRARLADRGLPRRGRRRHARDHRLRRRRPVEPPAPDPAPDAGRRPAEGRVRPRHHPRAESRRDGRRVQRAAHRRQHRADPQGLRRRRGRLGQLRDPLPGQRRLLLRWASPTSTARSSSSRAWSRCSPPGAARAIAASTRCRRPPGWSPPETKPASWACSRDSSGWCRRPRPSSCSSARASP